jgi:hypothetical protein
VTDELNINQETFKEIEMISRNLCYDLHVQRTLMYRRVKLAGCMALMTLGMAKLVNGNFVLHFKSVFLFNSLLIINIKLNKIILVHITLMKPTPFKYT